MGKVMEWSGMVNGIESKIVRRLFCLSVTRFHVILSALYVSFIAIPSSSLPRCYLFIEPVLWTTSSALD